MLVKILTSLTPLFRGTDNDDDTDQLWFATLAHQRRYRDSRECDQGEVTLFTEPDPDKSELLVLYHREGPRIDHEPGPGPDRHWRVLYTNLVPK